MNHSTDILLEQLNVQPTQQSLQLGKIHGFTLHGQSYRPGLSTVHTPSEHAVSVEK